MALNREMTIDKIEHFLLKGDMQDVIKYDIEPILHLELEPGGFFGAPRQILCMIDFLGAAYSGKYKNTARGAVKFIKNIMGSNAIDPNYKINGELMYKMYRHGLIHLFQPKKFILEDKTKVEWSIYKGSRIQGTLIVKSDAESYKFNNVEHLKIVKHPKRDTSVLFICLNSLIEDFKKSLEIYFQLINKDQKYLRRWDKVSSYIVEYEEIYRNLSFFEKIRTQLKFLWKGNGI